MMYEQIFLLWYYNWIINGQSKRLSHYNCMCSSIYYIFPPDCHLQNYRIGNPKDWLSIKICCSTEIKVNQAYAILVIDYIRKW